MGSYEKFTVNKLFNYDGKEMKKFLFLISSLFILNGCAETVALLGPASSAFSGGNVVQSSLTSAASFGIKRQTGKSPVEHAISYAKEHNPDRKKEKCLDFLEMSTSEVCTIAKKKVAEIKVKIKENYKIKTFDQ